MRVGFATTWAIEDPDSWFLVDAEDPVAGSVAALVRLAEPEVWHRVSQAAQRRGTEVLSWDHWASVAVEVCSGVRRRAL